jgi:hypothetical protein
MSRESSQFRNELNPVRSTYSRTCSERTGFTNPKVSYMTLNLKAESYRRILALRRPVLRFPCLPVFLRQGRTLGVLGEPDNYFSLRLAPDGQSAGVNINWLLTEQPGSNASPDILAYDVLHDSSTAWLATAANESAARFSPDGQWVASSRLITCRPQAPS